MAIDISEFNPHPDARDQLLGLFTEAEIAELARNKAPSREYDAAALLVLAERLSPGILEKTNHIAADPVD